MIMLAQAAPVLPDVSWWQEYGVLGIIAMICAGAICTAIWSLYFPHARAKQRLDLQHQERKQKLETLREEKLNVFIDMLSATHGEEVEFKRQIASAVTDIAKTQRSHSEGCARTEDQVREINERLRMQVRRT